MALAHVTEANRAQFCDRIGIRSVANRYTLYSKRGFRAGALEGRSGLDGTESLPYVQARLGCNQATAGLSACHARSSDDLFYNVETIKKWPELSQCAEARQNFLMRFASRVVRREVPSCTDHHHEPAPANRKCSLVATANLLPPRSWRFRERRTSPGPPTQTDDPTGIPSTRLNQQREGKWRSDPE